MRYLCNNNQPFFYNQLQISNKMKQKLLLSCVLLLSAGTIGAQKQYDDGQAEAALATQATAAQARAQQEGSSTFQVSYKRPRGVYYCPYYTKDDATGVWAYYAPWLHSTPYQNVTFVNTSTGATAFDWRVTVLKNLDEETITSSDTDFTVPYSLRISDSIPTLTATGAPDTTATYFMGGYNKSLQYVPSTMWTYPNWKYATSETYKVRHMWESSKYYASKTDRTGTASGSSFYYTLDAQYAASGSSKAYTFGRNTAGYDYSGVAFEKPAHPYLINHVGVKYQKLKWTRNANALIKVEIYELKNIPAYSDTQAVTPTLVRRIATGMVTIDSINTAASGMLSILMKDDDGNTPEINTDILVVVSGYNNDAISDFTLLCSSDKVDEGYGELGYLGITQSDGTVNLVGVNNTVGTNFYTAPSIFIETERPWLTFRSGIEPEGHDFLTTGEVYDLELFSSMPSTSWTINTSAASSSPQGKAAAAKVDLPSWLSITLREETGSELGYSTHAVLDAQALPAGEPMREATLRFAFPGAYLDYHITQGMSTAVTTISRDSEHDGAVYNMLGQKVSPNAKGVLIKNGKKTYVK